MWARQLGELNGITIPNQAAEHYYVITGNGIHDNRATLYAYIYMSIFI